MSKFRDISLITDYSKMVSTADFQLFKNIKMPADLLNQCVETFSNKDNCEDLAKKEEIQDLIEWLGMVAVGSDRY